MASIDEKCTLGIQWVWLFAVSGSKVTKLRQLSGTHPSLMTLFSFVCMMFLQGDMLILIAKSTKSAKTCILAQKILCGNPKIFWASLSFLCVYTRIISHHP